MFIHHGHNWKALFLFLSYHFTPLMITHPRSLTHPLKNDGWKTILSSWGPVYFQGPSQLNFQGVRGQNDDGFLINSRDIQGIQVFLGGARAKWSKLTSLTLPTPRGRQADHNIGWTSIPAMPCPGTGSLLGMKNRLGVGGKHWNAGRGGVLEQWKRAPGWLGYIRDWLYYPIRWGFFHKPL